MLGERKNILNAFVRFRYGIYFFGLLKFPKEGGERGMLITMGIVEGNVPTCTVIFFKLELEFVLFFLGFLMLARIFFFLLGRFLLVEGRFDHINGGREKRKEKKCDFNDT
jgi:hypothetical protein